MFSLDRGWFASTARLDGAGGFRKAIRSRLLRDLAGLSDHAIEVWTQESSDRITRVMAAKANVNCSPESPQTHKHAAAMKQRRVTSDGRVVDCEWHTKLEPHRNRVHFAVEPDHGHVVIGIFARHQL